MIGALGKRTDAILFYVFWEAMLVPMSLSSARKGRTALRRHQAFTPSPGADAGGVHLPLFAEQLRDSGVPRLKIGFPPSRRSSSRSWRRSWSVACRCGWCIPGAGRVLRCHCGLQILACIGVEDGCLRLLRFASDHA